MLGDLNHLKHSAILKHSTCVLKHPVYSETFCLLSKIKIQRKFVSDFSGKKVAFPLCKIRHDLSLGFDILLVVKHSACCFKNTLRVLKHFAHSETFCVFWNFIVLQYKIRSKANFICSVSHINLRNYTIICIKVFRFYF